MKRNIRRTFILFITFSLLLFFPLTASFAEEAKVISAKGTVEVQIGSFKKTLKTGDSIPEGSIVATGFKSEARISIGNNIVTLGPASRLSVQSKSTRKTSKRVDFNISEPVATASVRGMQFKCKAKKTAKEKALIEKNKEIFSDILETSAKQIGAFLAI